MALVVDQLYKEKEKNVEEKITTIALYRGENKGLFALLSRTQAGPGRKVKEAQEEISCNHVPRLFLGSVACPKCR